MQKLLISFLSGILILVSSSVFARDKQPRRFNPDTMEETTTQISTAPTTSKQNMTTEDRLSRLERLINSQGLVDLLLKLDALQKEVQQLRGDVETQTHIANDLKKRQRDLYIDIDRRLLKIERNGGSGTASNSSSVNALQSSSKLTSNSVSSSTQSSTKASGIMVSQQVKTKPVDPIKEQNAYQQAFDLLRELRYEDAIKAYRQFIKDYPNGRYAHIAQYWLSEASYAQRHFKQAINDYKALISNYPNSPKLAEAHLKIAYSYNSLKQNKAAIEAVNTLMRLYPNTTAAGQGQLLLKKIKTAKK